MYLNNHESNFFCFNYLQLISDAVYIYVSNHPSKVSSYPGPILENKGMNAIFLKKGKETLKKEKISDNLGKHIQNLTIF